MRFLRLPRWEDRDRGQAEAALGNLDLPHRRWLAEYLVDLTRHTEHPRILEVGCSYGPNLRTIANLATNLDLVGIDLSSSNIEVGIEQLDNVPTGCPITLEVGDASKPLQFADDSFDVVFTDATLLYFDPLALRRVLVEMTRVAKESVVTLELTKQNGLLRHWRSRDGWLHDYPACLGSLSSVRALHTERLPPHLRPDGPWATKGALTCGTLGH